MAVVYLDKVFLLNLLIDYILLLITARLGGMPLQRMRLLLCAIGGATYALASFLPGCGLLLQPVLRIAAGIGMALAAYWPLHHMWRLTGLFMLLSAALGGLVLAAGLAVGQPNGLMQRLYYAQISWPLLLGTTAGMYVLLRLLFSQGVRHGGGELMRIRISVHGKEQEITALHDTGNTLRDPVGGQPVLVMEDTVMEGQWEDPIAGVMRQQVSPEEKIARLHQAGVGCGFSLLPFRSVGIASGLLLAVRSDYVQVGKATYRKAWVALTPNSVSEGGAYRALWGGVKKGDVYGKISADAGAMDPQTQQAG